MSISPVLTRPSANARPTTSANGIPAGAHPVPGRAAPSPDVRTARAVRACELFEGVRRGDEAAWAELVRTYRRLLWSITRECRLSPEDAEDAIQATWTRLLENLDNIREPEFVHQAAPNFDTAMPKLAVPRPPVVKRSSGSRVRLPTTVMVLSAMVEAPYGRGGGVPVRIRPRP